MYVRELDYSGKLLTLAGLAFAVSSFFIDPARLYLLSATFSPNPSLTLAGESIISVFSIIIGALIATIGILISVISNNYSPEQYWNLVLAFLIWVIFDNLASWIFGYEYNLIINSLITLILIFLLYRIRVRYH